MEGYLGEVKYFGGTYPPKCWSYCDGQMLPIQNWAALYSIMGNAFGGDGVNNFGLPNLQGRIGVGSGQGKNLTYRHPGDMAGMETVQITEYTMPAHSHSVSCDITSGDRDLSSDPQDKLFAKKTADKGYGMNTTGNPVMQENMLTQTGTSYPHANMPPYTVLNHIICVQGIYPPRP
jgi:microcystin-dependent protein